MTETSSTQRPQRQRPKSDSFPPIGPIGPHPITHHHQGLQKSPFGSSLPGRPYQKLAQPGPTQVSFPAAFPWPPPSHPTAVEIAAD
eukprot:441447-Rhodomonas_salina.2